MILLFLFSTKWLEVERTEVNGCDLFLDVSGSSAVEPVGWAAAAAATKEEGAEPTRSAAQAAAHLARVGVAHSTTSGRGGRVRLWKKKVVTAVERKPASAWRNHIAGSWAQNVESLTEMWFIGTRSLLDMAACSNAGSRNPAEIFK